MTEYEKTYANFLYKFSEILKKYKNDDHSEIIFLCIGTSELNGDSFGPVVGNKLKERINSKKVIIFGDLKDNVNALNIEKNVELIKKNYKKPLVIAVDAALSRKEDIGKIKVYPNGIRIRRALENRGDIIGDLSIKAVVANNYKKALTNYMELKKTPLSRINYLSEITVTGIDSVIKNSNV